METISLRLEEDLLSDVEHIMKKYRYATKTEFVRAAIREKVKEFEREEFSKKVAMLAGSSKKKTTDEELHAAGDKAFDLLEKKHASRRTL